MDERTGADGGQRATVDFGGATFRKGVSFDGATFGEGVTVSFDGATFGDPGEPQAEDDARVVASVLRDCVGVIARGVLRWRGPAGERIGVIRQDAGVRGRSS